MNRISFITISKLLVGCLAIFLIACKSQKINFPTGINKASINIEGIDRQYEYYIPPGLNNSPSIVFVLHGSRGSIEDSRKYTNNEFEKLANIRKNQIIVYPQGYDNHWNDCRGTAGYKANQEDVNDIEFFTQMINYFEEKYRANENGMFVTGMSNGGHMCYKLAYELPEKISAIAPFIANLPESANNDCIQKNKPMSVMVINGTQDPINPNQGGWVVLGQDSTRGAVLSTANTIEYWKSLIGCDFESETKEYEDIAKDDDSNVVHYKYNCPNKNYKVELVQVINGGHVIPIDDDQDLPDAVKKFVGNKNRDINSPKIVLDFFESLLVE